MESDLFVLQVCEFLDTGDGYYRYHEPSRFLSRLPGVAVVDCDLNHHLLPELLDAADVLIIQDFDWDLFPLIERRRAAGRLTVQEANDDYFDLQPWNVRAAMWQNRSTRAELRQALAAVDAVQTSTAALTRRWQPMARRVAVFPNQLTHVPPLPPPPKRPLTIGWAGSIGHYADWYRVLPRLQKWLDAHPDVHLAVMSGEEARGFVSLPPERYHFTPGGSLADYVRFLSSLDIGLAPLLPSDFNRGRSDVKFLEYAAAGVAGIYPDLEPYRGSVVDGETGLIYRTEDDLIRALDRLVEEAGLRERLRRQAHEYVSRHRLLADHVGERLRFYQGLLPQPPRGYTIPDHVLAAATRDGRYLQLRPGAPEKALKAAVRGPANADAVRQVRGILERHPSYRAALRHLGRMLNELRDFAGADGCLQRLLALDPTHGTALAERGRARAGRGDLAGARATLEQAVAVNPHHQVAWQYLLRLVGQKPGAEAAVWAEKAHRTHPDNILLALQGVRLNPPTQTVALLHRLLDEYAGSFTIEEESAAAVVFGQEIATTLAGEYAAPGARELLRRACEVFPRSARLAGLHGQALFHLGDFEEALTHLTRAQELRRAADHYKQDFPRGDDPVLPGQMAEHIQKWQPADAGTSDARVA